MGQPAERVKTSAGPSAALRWVPSSITDRGDAMVRRFRRLLMSSRAPLYANAYALLANQVSSAALGFLYWLLAARLYPVKVVGESSAVISVLLLIAGLAQLGLDSGMVRFVPRAGQHARRLILAAYVIVPASAAVLSVGFLWLSEVLAFADKIEDQMPAPWLLVAATVCWSVFYFQDGILNGLRQSKWVLIENFLYNVSKIVLLVLAAWLLKEWGILGSWFLPTPLAIVLVAWLVFKRLARKDYIDAEATEATPLTRREVMRSVSGDHVGSVISEASVRLLPLFVVGLLGAAENAYFYQAWLVATTLSLAAGGMTHSFTAQAAADRANIGVYSRGILRHMLLVLAPVAVVIGVGAPFVLTLFGKDYSQAAPLLRWLALAAPLVIFDTWYLAYCRVVGRIGLVVTLQAVSAALLLGLSYAGLHTFGITGIGFAWLVSRAVVVMVALVDARAVLWGDEAGDRAAARSFGRLLGDEEARLILPTAPGDQITVIGTEEAATDPDGACDLAVVPKPSASSLAAAFAALRPGGACYSEWPAWRSGGASGVARSSARAGFTDARMYWPVGRMGHGRVLLAFPATDTYRTVIRRMVAERIASRPLRSLACAGVSFVLRTGLVPALAVVAYKPAEDTAAVEPRGLPDLVMDRIAQLDTGGPAERTLVMSTGAGRFNKKVHWLVFRGEEPELRWIVKIPRRAAGEAAILREVSLLEHLAAREDLTSRLVVPHVEFSSDATGFPIHVESALHGRRLDLAAREMPYPVLASTVTETLVALAGRPQAEAPAVWRGRIIEPWLAKLDAQLEGLDERRLVPALREALSGLGDLPLVCAHNDCAPWNAVLLDGRLGIFDWETGQECWLPAVDLVYCLSTTAFCLDGTANTPDAVRSYERLLDPLDDRGSAFLDSLGKYASRVGIREEDLPRLRLATWLMHTTEDLENVLAEASTVTPALLDRSVCLPLLRAELARLGPPDPAVGQEADAMIRDAVFVSPHLDDAVLSCGGAIQRLVSAGARVSVVTVCTADPPPAAPLSPTARRVHSAWALGDAPFATRCAEDFEALRRLGAEPVHLGFPDAVYRHDGEGMPAYPHGVSVAADPSDAEAFLARLRAPLSAALDAHGSATIFCPSGVGGHVDHVLVRQAVEELCDWRRIVYYEEYPYLSRRDVPRMAEPDADRWMPATLVPTSLELESRVKAITCYRSQLRGLFPTSAERLSEILSARVPVVGRAFVRPDTKPPLERVGWRVRRDVAARGGERYWSAVDAEPPLPPASASPGEAF